MHWSRINLTLKQNINGLKQAIVLKLKQRIFFKKKKDIPFKENFASLARFLLS